MGNNEPLSSVDAAWLGMEDPTNLMMVSGILTFDEPIEFERLKHVLETRMLQFRRFRQRVIQPRLPVNMPYWEDDPNFTIEAHVHRIALPAPHDQATLQDLCSDLMSTPLDFSKPLWQIHLIENYNGGCAIMTRLHHCIADGMALVMVLLSMTDMSPDAALPENATEPDAPEPSGGPIGALFKRVSSAAAAVRHMSGRVVSEGFESLINPAHAVELALKGSDNAVAAGRLVLRSADPQTIFKGELGVAKRASWSRPLPLKDIKAIKNVTGGTVNDVLVSALTGALRQYLIHRDQPVDGLNFRAAVPVNLRKPDEMGTLGNKFGLVFLSLPVGIGDPLERLAEVRQRMNELKNSQEAAAAFGILNAIGLTPKDVQEEIVKMFGAKATAVLTNVPGPPLPLYLAGRKITGLMFWVPQSGRVSLGLSILSYGGKVFLGIATDAGLVPDPERIIESFYDEYEALMALVQQAQEIEAAEKEAAAVSAAGETAVEHTVVAPTNDVELRAVKGIGPTFARRLQEAGVDNVARLTAMPVEALAQTLQVSPARAKSILAAAKENA